jgi:PIN domain nuclease of toxin-antitoxin system
VKLLLDTYAFLWASESPERLSQTVCDALTDADNAFFLSIASVWEIQIKVALGKLAVSRPLQEAIELAVDDGLQILPAELEHIYGVGALPAHHNDPFDRLLIAQALHEGFTIVTRDKVFPQYTAPLLW